MRISSFNINKFCGAYSSQNGGYYNPRNVDFKSSIKKIVDSLLNDKDDIVFLQEFVDNKYIGVSELFVQKKYTIFHNSDLVKNKSNVVAITLKNSTWEKIDFPEDIEFPNNKIIEMETKDKQLRFLSFHNTNNEIKEEINKYFETGKDDIILGDFNDLEWIDSLKNERKEYWDLVTNDMITYKPAQTAIDRIFIKKATFSEEKSSNKIFFNGVIETFASDHNILSFLLNY